ncbi:MAG: tetratricopeptide repeat protein, partial [Humidesulfovibrio sp.]|nr:tetratricopeptide repeat protein [Humidesulfovibrio sp.]
GDVGLLVKKGQALLRLHRPEAALEAFRLAVAASPESSGAHYGAGQASERLGQGEAARQSFERAVALVPESWRARCHLGVLLMNQGQPDKAVEQFLAALALPRFQTQAVAQAGAWTGIPAEAQAVAGREELLNNLAVAQVLSGRPEAAVKTFRQAMQGSRDPGRSANNLGLLLVRLGRPVEALEAFRSGGSDARALNNLGYALYLQGEVVRARALFEKALDLSPAYYETAGENLKQAVRGAPGNAGPGAATTAASPGGAAAGGRPAGHGQEDKNIGEGAASQDLERLSLTGRGAVGLHFGQASLLGEGAARHWAY